MIIRDVGVGVVGTMRTFYWQRNFWKGAVAQTGGQRGRSRENTGGTAFSPAQPRAVGTALFPGGVRWGFFWDENEVGCLFRGGWRLLKISASKAAGSGTTEAYPCGTSQGGTRL